MSLPYLKAILCAGILYIISLKLNKSIKQLIFRQDCYWIQYSIYLPIHNEKFDEFLEIFGNNIELGVKGNRKKY